MWFYLNILRIWEKQTPLIWRCNFLFTCLIFVRLPDWRREQEKCEIRRPATAFPIACAWSYVNGALKCRPRSMPSLFPMRFVSHLIFHMCVAFTEGKQIGNKFRLEKLYPGTSSSHCSRMSHPTPRENSNNVIIWFPFQALCIFIYAKEFSKPSNWHSNRKTSFRAQVYKQTNSFCAWKLILHNSKLPAACWTGRRGRESAHLSGRWSRWWSPLLTFQQSQK